MRLISTRISKERRPQSTKSLPMLDDAEMALTLNDLGESSPDSSLGQTLLSPELLAEYASAASMIMDRDEREQVARELLFALQNHRLAA